MNKYVLERYIQQHVKEFIGFQIPDFSFINSNASDYSTRKDEMSFAIGRNWNFEKLPDISFIF